MSEQIQMLDGRMLVIGTRRHTPVRVGLPASAARRVPHLCRATISTQVAAVPLTGRLTLWVSDDGQARRRNTDATLFAARFGVRRHVFGLAAVCATDEDGAPTVLTDEQFAAVEAVILGA